MTIFWMHSDEITMSLTKYPRLFISSRNSIFLWMHQNAHFETDTDYSMCHHFEIVRSSLFILWMVMKSCTNFGWLKPGPKSWDVYHRFQLLISLAHPPYFSSPDLGLAPTWGPRRSFHWTRAPPPLWPWSWRCLATSETKRANWRSPWFLMGKTSTLWLFNIATENPLQMEVLMGNSSINGPFSMAMLNNQRV